MRLINALWMSFYSRSLYREVFGHWKGISFLYLCLLALILTVVSSSQFDAQLDILVRDEAPAIVQQLPEVVIRGGQASTPEAKAYPIYDGQSGRLLALIDTRLEQPPAGPASAPVFVGKNGFLLTYPSGETKFFDFDLLQDSVIGKAQIVSWLQFVSKWAFLLISPFLLIGQTLGLLFQLFFFSLFTWLNLKSSGIQASYAAILRLTSVSLSPAILVSMIFMIFMPDTPSASFFRVLLAVGYISFASHAVKNPGPFPKDASDEE